MKKYTHIISIMFLGLALVACDDTGGGGTNTKETAITGVVADGQTFYNNECSACHTNGADDTVSAFNASNLSQKHAKIKSDMSTLGGTPVPAVDDIMGRFSNLSDQRVADLQAYLKSL